ncbi:MAG: TrkA family potassium uptake protein [Desulfobacterales bacterium]
MRIVFAGAGPMTVITTRSLTKQGHDVVIIEVDKEKIDEISDELDCSFINGDASKPAVLSQANPNQCDFLFCLTGSDQINIITALLGRSMGFKRVVPAIENVELEQLCKELGLEDTIIPVHMMNHYLVNMVQGLDNIELFTFLKDDARLFTFKVRKAEKGRVGELDLPEGARAIFYYRQDRFYFAEEGHRFKENDEIVILTHRKHLQELKDRWPPENAS